MPRSILTPAQAADLVEHFGGIKPATRGAGIPFSTLWASLNRDLHRERCREYGASDHAKALNAVRQRRLRERWADQGLCIRCGKEPPVGAVCWTCLNEMEGGRP